MFLLLGKLLSLVIWGVMVINLFFPFPSPAHIFMNGALLFLVVTRGLQVRLLNQTLTRQEKEQKYRCLKLFIFGVFESISWRKEQ